MTLHKNGLVGIIPAYAGSTSLVMRSCCLGRDHPRIRGEHDKDQHTQAMIMGSSPHTRGARSFSNDNVKYVRIIPAYAGSTKPTAWTGRRWPDHPRIRGEHFSPICTREKSSGSSPHTRGALEMTLHKNGLAGIIPAYAGSTPPSRPLAARVADHPRIRGEH